MASAQVIITITDTPSHSLVQIREALLIKWNYLGGGGMDWTPTGTANDKLLFIQAYTAKNWFKKEYKEQLQIVSQVANEAADVDIQ